MTRLGLRMKEAVTIIVFTFLVVAATTVIHLSQLTRVIAQEALGQADVITKQIYSQARRSVSRGQGRTVGEIFRRDEELRGLLEASVGYSPYLLYAMIVDRKGRAILHSEREKEGSQVPERTGLRDVLSAGPVRRLQVLYRSGNIYEATLPLSLGGRPFGQIRLGVASSLLGRELRASLRQSFVVAGLALPLAWLVAVVLANRFVVELRAKSLSDELTGLYNRRGFFFLIQQQLKIADRTKRGFVLVFADLDNMKQINDTFGHREGDRALIEAANLLTGAFRGADIVARIGGDEFAVVAIEAGKDAADTLAARLQEQIDARNRRGDLRFTLSLSVGMSRYDPDCPCSIDELIARADALMYEQKQGRSRAS
jgi:diguanylate cyclase (GGDEF)-like protein